MPPEGLCTRSCRLHRVVPPNPTLPLSPLRTGTLLIVDETHTISAGPGGYTHLAGLQPDIFVIGKPIAGGVPVAVYGFTEEVGGKLRGRIKDDESDTGGIGGTLAGNALSIAATRATLEGVLTEEAYRHMIRLGERFEAGVAGVIRRYRLPWIVKRLGCRVEYWFRWVAGWPGWAGLGLTGLGWSSIWLPEQHG